MQANKKLSTNAPKILDLKSSSEQMFAKLTLGAPDLSLTFAVCGKRESCSPMLRTIYVSMFSDINWSTIAFTCDFFSLFSTDQLITLNS